MVKLALSVLAMMASISLLPYARYQKRNIERKYRKEFLNSNSLFTLITNSTFANVEVKEFKEVREVKAICFIAKYTTKKAIGYNF